MPKCPHFTRLQTAYTAISSSRQDLAMSAVRDLIALHVEDCHVCSANVFATQTSQTPFFVHSGPKRSEAIYDLVDHLRRQKAFSEKTFGPGKRTQGLIDHIRKELDEIEENPNDILEWIDVVLLGFDGAWRAGFTEEQIAEALRLKLERNENRKWPDWRTQPADKAIEHVEVEV